jgi:hypothetical protein
MPQAAQQNPAVQNIMARQQLIATGLPFTKHLPAVTNNAVPGQTVRVPLDRTGIVTGVTLLFTVPLNITVAATQSPFGPYNLISNIQYVDFAGVKHVNTSGIQLHVLNALKSKKYLDNSHKMQGYITGAETGIDTDILNFPTAAAAASAFFSLYIPLAYDPMSDLRGAILAQTDRGDHYLNVTFANAFVNADPLIAPYSAGTVALQNGTTITIDPYLHYLMPQAGVSPNNLPMIDLGTIYEIQGGMIDSSSIVAGQSKFVNWPNNRAVLSALHIFDQAAAGGTLNGADLNLIVLLINGNTNVRELTPRLLRLQQRFHLGSDLASGLYYLSARQQPITTQLYGNVQTRFDIATAGAGSYFMNQYESMYLSGTPLPGVVQP